MSILYWINSEYIELIKPNKIRRIISGDSALLTTLIKISEYEYSKDERKRGASIYSILDTLTVKALSLVFGDARLMLFPIGIGTNSVGIGTNGKINVRLYDLLTGDLIYEKDQQLFVEQVGEDGVKSLLYGLIGFSRDHYDKYFFEKFKNSLSE